MNKILNNGHKQENTQMETEQTENNQNRNKNIKNIAEFKAKQKNSEYHRSNT